MCSRLSPNTTQYMYALGHMTCTCDCNTQPGLPSVDTRECFTLSLFETALQLYTRLHVRAVKYMHKLKLISVQLYATVSFISLQLY